MPFPLLQPRRDKYRQATIISTHETAEEAYAELGVKVRYPNYIATGFLSGMTLVSHEGLQQLRIVMAKVRRAAEGKTGGPARKSQVGWMSRRWCCSLRCRS